MRVPDKFLFQSHLDFRETSLWGGAKECRGGVGEATFCQIYKLFSESRRLKLRIPLVEQTLEPRDSADHVLRIF